MPAGQVAVLLGLSLAASGLIAGLAGGWPRLVFRADRRLLLIAAPFGLVIGVGAAFAKEPVGQGGQVLAGLALLFIALVDLRRFAIPAWGLAMLGVAAGLSLVLDGDALARLLTGAAAALVFAALRRFVHIDGRPGVGAGDVALAGLIGLLLGWVLLPLVVAVAAGSVLAIQALTGRRGPVPFGFWLCGWSIAALAGRHLGLG